MQVPGSPFLGYSHPYGWFVRVREKRGAKKETTYWVNGSYWLPEDVAALVADRFPNVDVLKIERATKPPGQILKPVPPHHFQYGLLNPQDPDPEEAARPLQPLWRPGMPLSSLPKSTPFPKRKPLWPPHR